MTSDYGLHGLRVRSEVPLDAPEAGAERPDLVIRSGARRTVPNNTPDGKLVALLELPGGTWSAVRHAEGYTVRLHQLCDVEIDTVLRQLTVHLAPGEPDELASVLLSGVLATLLTLRGHCVLHASAVETADGVVAFVGPSSAGKTTVAALACAEGARLVTDDALRVECDGARAWCFNGSTGLRLRTSAAELAEAFGGAVARSTIDGRIAISPTRGAPSRLPLRAIVAPVCAHGGTRLEIERRYGLQAVLELVRNPRTAGWINGEVTQRDFAVMGQLAAAVPIYRAWLPWGPPFSSRWARKLLDSLDPAGASER
jgi:hypothetical protein